MKANYNFLLAILLLLITQISFAQVQSVSGVVTDQSGVPIPGVNVVVKNNKTGTQTDLDGKYSIKAKLGDILIFSFVGMTETTFKVGSSSTADIKMQDGVKLQEVVVTALGITREKKSLGYATQEVKAADLESEGHLITTIGLLLIYFYNLQLHQLQEFLLSTETLKQR